MNLRILLVLTALSVVGCTNQPQTPDSNLSSTQSALDPLTPFVADDQQLDTESSIHEQAFASHSSDTLAFWDRLTSQMLLVDQYQHQRIDKHLDWFTNNQTYFDRVISRAEKYIYHILERIEAEGLPVELALLPIVESAYDPFAYSHSHAAGLWQFIPSTGKVYGLNKDWWYDGRRDVVASTDAAITYLSHLHQIFDGDWLLALAAYNSGQGNVRRAIKRNQRAGKPTDFWSLKLPRETKAYVPQLLAIAKVFKNPEHYDIHIPSIPNQAYFVALDLEHQIDLSKAAEMADISDELLAQLNPAFNRRVTHPAGPHRLLVPVDKSARFLTSLASLPAEHWRPNAIYKVKSGDSLYTIARKHKVTIGQLKSLNNLSSNTLQIGQRLQLPGLGDSNSAGAKSSVSYHQVTQGDTLWGIAKQYKVSVKQLVTWNKLNSNQLLQPGQQLKLAKNVVIDKKRVKKVRYKVRRGDSLSRIAGKFNLKINDIVSWNDINLQQYLKPGQRLTLFVDIRNI